MDTKELLEQTILEEKQLQFSKFDADDAWRLGNILVDLARQESWDLAISIEANEKQLFYYAFQGTHLNHQRAVERKRNVAHVFRCSSLRVFCELELSHTTIGDRGREFRDFLPLGGAFPICVEGVGQIGTVCVSGLDHKDDHKTTVRAIRTFLAETP